MPTRSHPVNGKARQPRRPTPARTNRGPAAASENRDAILAAARATFRERGYHVPFSAIAKAAGVAQAVMYRHFPSKLDLALAIMDGNLTELESLAAQPDPDAFWRTWNRLVEMTIECAAFIEMAVEARLKLPDYEGSARLHALIAEPLQRARAAGTAPGGLTVEEVLLTEKMVYGVVASTTSPRMVREDVARALALVGWTAARPG